MQKKQSSTGKYKLIIWLGIVGLTILIVWHITKSIGAVIGFVIIELLTLVSFESYKALSDSLSKKLNAPLAGLLSDLIDEFLGNKKNTRSLRRYLISIAHPRKFSKRYTSPMYIHFYFPENRFELDSFLELSKYKKFKLNESIFETPLSSGLVVKIALSCPVVEFSAPVIKKLDKDVISTSFTAKPLDECYSGKHTAIISITDKVSEIEYVSINFEIEVVDFAFDHISRPLIANIISIILGIGSLLSFLLAIVGKLDTTFGLTAGTTAGIIAASIQAISWNLYNRSRFRSLLP